MIEILEYKLKHIMTNNPIINKIIYFPIQKNLDNKKDYILIIHTKNIHMRLKLIFQEYLFN